MSAVLVLAAGIASGAANTQPAAPEISTICVDASNGAVLSEQNADQQRAPASMVKMIQLLLVAEGLKTGRWTLETPIPISEHAQRMGGTQVFLTKGQTWPLGQLMNAVAVASANDAAMAVAEGLWGSEQAYLEAANLRANELGMSNTIFYSVHGLPPDKGKAGDLTTSRDMAILARHCAQQAQIMEWVGQKEFRFRPGDAVIYNTNKLLWRMENCDGIKTGYTRASGFCVAATAKRDGIRLICVVMGSPSKYGRFNLAKELMEKGFAELRRMQAASEAEPTEEGKGT